MADLRVFLSSEACCHQQCLEDDANDANEANDANDANDASDANDANDACRVVTDSIGLPDG